jgi:hypothetical protein
MPVPPATLSSPSLSSDQLQFQGVTIGPGTPYQITKLEQMDKPDVRSGNVNWSMWPGASVGNNQLNTRKPVLTLDVGPPYGTYSTLPGAVKALVTACSTEGSTEYPLWIQLPGMPFVCTMARVLKTNFPWDLTADLGGLLQNGSIQFECTDPYLYSAPTTVTTISLPGPAGGFSFPLSFPLSFGGGSSPNTATISNAGDVTCWPTLVINGPCLDPTVSNTSITGNPTISTSIQLYAGDQMWIDCRMGSILVYRSGSSVGAPSQYVLQPGSEYFGLPPGSSNIAFNSSDTSAVAGTLAVWSASAFDALL